MALDWTRLHAALREGCAAAGLDIVHPFGAGVYNHAVTEPFRLEDFGRLDAFAVLVGNTRALWIPFLDAVRADPALAAQEHPLERYVAARLESLLAIAAPLAHRLYWAHDVQPRALPIQRLAELVGLASLAPSHLSVHPVHGPWFALRAAITFDLPGPSSAPEVLASPCARCSKPCLPALDEALARSGPEPGAASVADHADAWIAIRDACPVGRASRYDTEQLRYHYTKDRALLR